MPREKTPCGNPLFLSWVQELRDKAREKGTKAAETYQKACISLERCPVSYARPRDLICLTGIGPKTVHILEGKWKTHCAENGLPAPGSPEKRHKGKSVATPDSGSDTDNPAHSPPKKRKTTKPKTYIPQRGSGGYGILLSLVLAIGQPVHNTQVFLTKSEVIRGGQAYSDSSYEHSEKGTYFNAWASMKTLVGKGYVYVTGNPHKYCLTEEGYEVACAIRALRPEFTHIDKNPFLHSSAVSMTQGVPVSRVTPTRLVPPVAPRYPLSPPESVIAPIPVAPRSSRPDKFLFWYIDPTGCRTSSLNSAMVRLDPEDFINIRKIEFRVEQQSHPFAKQLRLVETDAKVRDGSGISTLFGYILEDGAPPKCSRFDEDVVPVVIGLRGSQPRIVSPINDARSTDDDWVDPPIPLNNQYSHPHPGEHSASTISRTASAPVGPSRRPLDPGVSAARAANRIHKPAIAGPNRSSSATEASPSKRAAPRLSSHVPAPTPLIEPDEPSSVIAAVPNFSPVDAITFLAGSYEIVLMLDTREVESSTNRDKIAEALGAKGVKVETRALRLGDMCWIARRCDGLGGEEDECVLDYVVERKRLDDLCSSIKDGRYNEQCFRLSNSCINHVFYIVEDWQVGQNMEYSGLQIMTAKSQIQVHNRFFLKETHRLSETTDFLATMTDVIASSHVDKDLSIIPTRFLSRSSYAALQTYLRKERPSLTFLTSFTAYQDLNDKSASKTLREKFARMLLCVKGMSAERVSAVLDEWDTPKALWDALKVRSEAVEEDQWKSKTKTRGREMFFADRMQGEGRRKVGDALSRDLYQIFVKGTAIS